LNYRSEYFRLTRS